MHDRRPMSPWFCCDYCVNASRLAFAPRSSAKRKSADGNLSFMALIRLWGSLVFLSSSSKANRYFSVKSTAVFASRGAPTLLCPGTTIEGFNSQISVNEFNHFSLALLPVSAVLRGMLLSTTSPAHMGLCAENQSNALLSV